MNGVFQCEPWERDCEMEKQRETGTWKTRLFLSGSQLGLWRREKKNVREAQREVIFCGRNVPSPLLGLSPVSLWVSNQNPAEPMPVPLLYILMNQGNYSHRVWSVSVWCFFSTVTVHSVFVMSCLDNFSLSVGYWIKISWGQSMSANLDFTQDAMLKARQEPGRLTHRVHTRHDGAATQA